MYAAGGLITRQLGLAKGMTDSKVWLKGVEKKEECAFDRSLWNAMPPLVPGLLASD
jgi:hypothetical protein